MQPGLKMVRRRERWKEAVSQVTLSALDYKETGDKDITSRAKTVIPDQPRLQWISTCLCKTTKKS